MTKPADLGCRAETWFGEDRIDRLERGRLFVVREGVLVHSEDVEVAHRIDSIRVTKEGCESTFEEMQANE